MLKKKSQLKKKKTENFEIAKDLSLDECYQDLCNE